MIIALDSVYRLGRNMATFQFRLVTQQVENSSFDCGVNSINDYVKNSYYPLITQQAYTYSITAEKVLLGYYQILFREIIIEDFPEEISDYYDPGVKDGKITSLHIRYIAIDKDYQNKNIGTGALRSIIKDVLDYADFLPIRVITIDARNDLVDWYKSEGFEEMKINTEGQDGTTVAMFYDCMKYSSELEEYLDMMV